MIVESTTSVSISKFVFIWFNPILLTATGICGFVAIVLALSPFVCCVEHRMDFKLSLGHIWRWFWIAYNLFRFMGELLIQSDVDVVDGHWRYVLFFLFLSIFLDSSLVHNHFFLFDHFDIFLFELDRVWSIVVNVFKRVLIKGKRK